MLTNITLYHAIYSVRYYPRFHVTAIGLATLIPAETGVRLYLKEQQTQWQTVLTELTPRSKILLQNRNSFSSIKKNPRILSNPQTVGITFRGKWRCVAGLLEPEVFKWRIAPWPLNMKPLRSVCTSVNPDLATKYHIPETLNHTHLLFVKREETNKMEQSHVYYQLLSQHVSGIIMPIFRRTKALLLHLVCCSGSAGCGC